MSEHLSRRRLLGAIAWSPALAVPGLVAAKTQPNPASATDRAKHHFAEFAKAMDELASDAHGWTLMAGNRETYRDLPGGNWATPVLIRYESDTDPRLPKMIVERLVNVQFELIA